MPIISLSLTSYNSLVYDLLNHFITKNCLTIEALKFKEKFSHRFQLEIDLWQWKITPIFRIFEVKIAHVQNYFFFISQSSMAEIENRHQDWRCLRKDKFEGNHIAWRTCIEGFIEHTLPLHAETQALSSSKSVTLEVALIWQVKFVFVNKHFQCCS